MLGLDRESGAMAITDRVRVGQTVQFHVRDAETADEDLQTLLEHGPDDAPEAARRGTALHLQRPRHAAVRARRTTTPARVRGVGPVPLAGFFAQGELGPVGGQNFIHGFTASVVLFEE